MKKLLALLVVLAILCVPVGATITVPNVFTPFTTISSSQVNANFSTIASEALDKRGDTMTGTLNSQVVLPDIDATRNLGSASFRFLNEWLSGALTVGTITLTGGTFGGNVTFSNNVTVTGTLTASGAASLPSLTITSPLPIASGGTNAATTPTAGAVAMGTGTAYGFTAAGTAGQYLISAGAGTPTWAGVTSVFNAGNTASAITINFSTNGLVQKATRNASTTITLTAPALAGTVVLQLVHDATGTAYTVAFSPSVKWPSGNAPTFTNTASAVDIVTLYWDGSNWYGSVQTNLS